MKRILIATLLALALLTCAACGQGASTETPATVTATFAPDDIYDLDEGATTFDLEVRYENLTAKLFRIHTDETTVGAALRGAGLIEAGDNGVYVTVDGVTADYNADQSYWAFYVNGEYATQGLDETPIEPGRTYGLIYTK